MFVQSNHRRKPHAAWHHGQMLPDCPTSPALVAGIFCCHALRKAPQLIANVMLKSFCHRGQASYCTPVSDLLHVLKLHASQRYTSTNTAINKSLRRSQHESSRSERRPSGRDAQLSKRYFDRGSPRERVRKPNHELGLDVGDNAELTRRNHRLRAPNQARTTRRSIKEEKPRSNLERNPRKPSYNYDPKPGGNRATRRASEFGHKLEKPVVESSNQGLPRAFENRRSLDRRASYSSEPDRPSYASRRPIEREQDRDIDRGLSTSEHSQDDLQSFLKPKNLSFTKGRRDGSSSQNRFAGSAGDSRHERARSGPFNGQERDHFRGNDRSPRHQESNVPLSIPYTTPASEFLYGTSVVTSALLASRRKLYRLYIYDGDNREVRDQDSRIRRLALDRDVVVERVQGSWLRLMDKTSTGRPHNVRLESSSFSAQQHPSILTLKLKGYILEASPIPQLPVVGLRSVENRQGEFHVLLNHQTREDEAINGTNTEIKYEAQFPRYPLVLLLDGIVSGEPNKFLCEEKSYTRHTSNAALA